MDTETLGKLHGYIQWAADVHWNKEEQDAHKREVLALLEQHRDTGFVANALTLQELRMLVNRKQVPLHAAKKEVSLDIKDTVEEIQPYFQKMHIELFAQDILHAVRRVYENSLIVHDSLLRQARLIQALTVQTFDELLPHIFFLYRKECHLQNQIQQHVSDINRHSFYIISHLNKNYFQHLAKLTTDSKFRQDHHDIFVASYILSLCSRALAQEYGISYEKLASAEATYIANIAPYSY